MDIVCDQEKRILLYQELRNMDLGRWQFEGVFTLDSSVNDLEIRLWVDEKSELTLEHITLSTVTESQGLYAVSCGTQH
jgi:hypothetical protein